MKAEQLFEREATNPDAPLARDATPRAGERWVLRCSRVSLEAAGCLVHFAAPLTVDVVGGANVYVLTDAGRRGWLRVRDLVAHWRRAATPPRSALASPDGSHLAT